MTDSKAGIESESEDKEGLSAQDRVALGLELIAHIETDTMPLSEVMKRIETVTTVASTQRQILNTAEERGLLVRDREHHLNDSAAEDVRGVYLSSGKTVGEVDVERREGDYDCERCGASLSTGHFVTFSEHEHGPFGPECVRKVLGRA